MLPKHLNLVNYSEIVQQFLEVKSDRASAILAASYLEQALKEFIQICIIMDAEKAADILINTRNSVHNFSAMINFAYGCEWITNGAFRDLNTIRLIRNEFAHEPYKNDFSQIPDEPRFRDYSQIYYAEDMRSQYLITISMTVGIMWNTVLPFLRKKKGE